MAHITHIGKQFKMIGILATGGDFSGRGGGGGCVEEKGGVMRGIYLFFSPPSEILRGGLQPVGGISRITFIM